MLSLGGFDGAGRLNTGCAAGKGQQSDIARALDGDTEPALMAGANASHAARQNLAAFLHELRQDIGALVVDEVHLFDTELADLLFAEILTLSAGTPAWAARTTRTAFAASATRTTFATASTAAVTAFATGRALRATLAATLWLPSAFSLRRSGSGSLWLFLFL